MFSTTQHVVHNLHSVGASTRRESEMAARGGEGSGSQKEMTLEDQMLEQSGYTGHGEW